MQSYKSINISLLIVHKDQVGGWACFLGRHRQWDDCEDSVSAFPMLFSICIRLPTLLILGGNILDSSFTLFPSPQISRGDRKPKHVFLKTLSSFFLQQHGAMLPPTSVSSLGQFQFFYQEGCRFVMGKWQVTLHQRWPFKSPPCQQNNRKHMTRMPL